MHDQQMQLMRGGEESPVLQGAAIGIHLFMISNLEADYYNKDYIYEVVVPDSPAM